MNTKHSIWMAVSLLVLMALSTSCIEDGFTTSPSDVLAFNMDTVAFDTVITLQGTATKQMIVYNNSKKQINISSIKVAGLASKGHFHLNVDGIRGDEFQNVEIRGNDSIFIFIEAKLDEMEQNEPTLIEDILEFVTNGKTQKVLLSAWGQDVIRINGDTISRNTRLTADKPYLIYDTVFIKQNATLTIDAGTTLLFHDKAALRCAGKILANGTAEAPITFRGDRLDRIVGETSFDIMSGQWGGVIFTPPTSGFTRGSVLKHVVMKSSSIGMHCSADGGSTPYGDTTHCALKLVNCVLTNSASTCLVAQACYVEAIGTEFSDAALGVVYFNGGKVRASQCTFANYYLFDVPDQPILNVFDLQYLDGTISKIRADFNNCIIYGLCPGINVEEAEDLDNNFDVHLNYCMLKTGNKVTSSFTSWLNQQYIIEGEPKFLTVRDDYLFDYRLGNESDAIGKGNRALCPEDEGRYDRYGNDRFERDGIDLGAYVWKYIEEEN